MDVRYDCWAMPSFRFNNTAITGILHQNDSAAVQAMGPVASGYCKTRFAHEVLDEVVEHARASLPGLTTQQRQSLTGAWDGVPNDPASSIVVTAP